MAPPASLHLTVTRREPELLAPAKPTPHESKELSDIDDQRGLRFQVPIIQFYRDSPLMRGRDPVKVIREALAQTLVFYYPFAGRLREGPGSKLIVDCTGEGVLFMEADADITLDQFGDQLEPPFPFLGELLYDVPGSGDILNCPLLLIQVTRLRCGGFVLVIRFNHTMSDGYGMAQFIVALGEMARGAHTPSIQPVWCRELLNARNPPHITCTHPEYDEVTDTKYKILPRDDMIRRSFFFGRAEISRIRRFLPHHLISCTSFEVLTACLWRCRTSALQLDPNMDVRMIFTINVRSKLNPPLPSGYYGNAIGIVAAFTSAGELCRNSLEYALELVRKAKNDVNHEYIKSVADLMVLKGRPPFTVVLGSYGVSDLRWAGLEVVDYGWGKAVYGGPAKGEIGDTPGFANFYVPSRKKNGEDGILVPICLPAPVMERFVKELDIML